jgi:excisionase family DNA binding protein
MRVQAIGRVSDMLSRPFLTTHEIAELLKVREQTVRGWIHQHELRAVRLGREFRVAARDLEAFVEERATRAPSRPAPPGPPPTP